MPRKILAILSFVLAAIAAAAYLSTFRTSAGHQLLFPLVFTSLLFGFIAIVFGRRKGDRRMELSFPKDAPRWVASLMSVLILGFFVHFFVQIRAGTPIEKNGGFFRKTSSAEMVAISQTEYENLKATETRTFAFVWFTLNVALGLTLWFKERR